MYQKRVVLKKEGSEVWCLDSISCFIYFSLKAFHVSVEENILYHRILLYVKLRTEREIFITLACQRGAD